MTSITAEQAIRKILATQTPCTQSEIVEAMKGLGIKTNQSKVSRLLKYVQAVKVDHPLSGSGYRLPSINIPPTSMLSLKSMVNDIDDNHHLIVIHTCPGGASLVARLLDHHVKVLGIMGVVAGDDTIFVAPAKDQQCDIIIKRIYTLLEDSSSDIE